MESEDTIGLFNRLADAVQSKIPMWLVMMEMTPEEISALERFLIKCEERSIWCENVWKEGESEKQRLLCDLIKQVHRRR